MILDRIKDLVEKRGEVLVLLHVNDVWLAETGILRHTPEGNLWRAEHTALGATLEGAVEGVYGKVIGRE